MTGDHDALNADLLGRLPLVARRVLQIGCGDGALGRAYKTRNPAAVYIGVETSQAAAAAARVHLDHVIVGDIEQAATVAALDAILAGAALDLVILGEAMMSTANPDGLLVRLRKRTARGGVCVADILNVDWASRSAAAPRRAFTLESAAALFRRSGCTLADGAPRALRPRDSATPASPAGWLIRSVNGPAPQSPLRLVALTVAKVGGIAAVRVEEPLAAVASQLCVSASWSPQQLQVGKDDKPAVLVLQRQVFSPPAFLASMNGLAARGWILVSEVDDDPRERPGFAENDFLAFRAAHAVTVSTEPLADIVRRWNPNVAIFPNAVAALIDAPPATPKQGGRLRVFFGALNRETDWGPLMTALNPVMATLADRIEVVVAHDRAFHDALPASVAREFHELLPYDRYKALLATCDIALLPLADTVFNRHKSDLKLIECCAAGVVPICSPTVYADDARHADVALFADSGPAFADALATLCDDLPRLKALRAAGLAYVRAERMQANQVRARETFYRRLMTDRAALEAQRRARLSALERR